MLIGINYQITISLSKHVFFLYCTGTQGIKEKPLIGKKIEKYQRQVVVLGKVMFVNDNRIWKTKKIRQFQSHLDGVK